MLRSYYIKSDYFHTFDSTNCYFARPICADVICDWEQPIKYPYWSDLA